ncbi:MAG: ATP-binding protein [Acidipila sp.]|nr:ATP-binding protein [Acidipila sp.]
MGASLTATRTTVEVIPSARRLVRSLRDLGYDFVHAVADLVDNSIAASASRVVIDLKWAGPDSWVRVADNGTGMSGTTITEAMRFGSERDYELDDLGKFGLGLKTASLSQCRRLTVASRVDRNQRRIEVRRWDLDLVEKSNRWEIEILGSDERHDNLVEPLQEQTGTVVLWESLERVLKYRVAWGESSKNALYKLAEQLDQHLGMVFHRFLSGEARRRKKLAITVNGTAVEPWDPYAREQKATEVFPSKEFELHTDDGKGAVRYQPYVLPPKEKFSSLRAFERMSGPEKWNRQQGFYIYRADRLIQSGGWSRMRTADEHTKLARAAIDFYPDLDPAFEVNVAKFRVTLPPELKDQLEEPVERLVKRAKAVYSGGKGTLTSSSSSRTGVGSFRGGGATGGGTGKNTGSRAFKRVEVRSAFEQAAADAGELEALKKIIRALAKRFPELADEFGF